MALFNPSISFLMLRSSFSILEEPFPEVLSRLLACEFNSSSFWFSPISWCSAFWDSIVFRSSSFWRVNSSTLAKRAWICCCCTTSGYCAISSSISYFKELFYHWERWLKWLAFPTDGTKLMMKKLADKLLVVADGRSCDWGCLRWRKSWKMNWMEE